MHKSPVEFWKSTDRCARPKVLEFYKSLATSIRVELYICKFQMLWRVYDICQSKTSVNIKTIICAINFITPLKSVHFSHWNWFAYIKVHVKWNTPSTDTIKLYLEKMKGNVWLSRPNRSLPSTWTKAHFCQITGKIDDAKMLYHVHATELSPNWLYRVRN